jgi:hypothetical protein
MSILPEGEQLRKAIKWVSDQRIEDPESKLYQLVEEASQEFDLSPKDEEFLVHFFTEQIL